MGKTYNVRLSGVMLDGVMKDPETKLLTTHINNDNIHVSESEKTAIAAVSNLSALIDSANETIAQVNGAVAEEATSRQNADNELTVAISEKVDSATFTAKASELEAADTALQTAIDGKVSVNGTDRLMTVLEGQKLEAYPAYSEVESAIGSKADSVTVNAALADVYTKAEAEEMVDEKIASAVSSVHSFKGQVADMAALNAVTGQVAGDIYNVVSTEKGTSAEYYWTGSAWEEFGTTIDMSGYATKDYADEKVATETARAQAAEEQNANAIGSESTVRDEADTALNDKIDAEAAQARAAEGALSDRIEAAESSITVINSGAEVEGSISYAVKAEADRAKAAEAENATALANEVAAARAAEQSNAAGIAAEITRAQSAESAIATNVSAISSQIEQINGNAETEGSIAYAVKAEENRAKTVEEGFDTDLEEIGTAITNLNTRIGAAEDSVTAEMNRATTKEAALENNISANAEAIAGLTNTVGGLDATFASKVDVSTYTTKVGELESAIALKASSADLTTAISGVYTKAETDAAIGTAVSEAVASVYKFKGQVPDLSALNAIEDKAIGDVYHVVSTDKGSSAEYFYSEDGWEELGTTISLSGYATTSALEAEASRAQSIEASISQNVSANASALSTLANRVDSNEAAIAGKAPIGAYDSAISALQTSVAAETSNREAAIAEKTVEINALKNGKVESVLTNSTTGSRMLIFNEMDGGGSKVEHSVNTKGDRLFCTYVGLNDSGTLGMPADNDVLGQIYAINTATDPETGKKGFGLRLNFYKNRLCYFPAAFAGESSNDPNRELAVKEDIEAEASKARSAEANNQSLSVSNYATLMNYINMLQSQIISLKQATHTSLSGITAADDAVIDINTTVTAGAEGLDTKNAANITANSVQVKELSVDSVRLNISATEDVTISNMNSTGNYPKASSNASNSINADGYVAIKESSIGQNGYNAIEIGSVKESKGIVIDGVEFTGTFSNNTISIFKNADNCVVTISNCHFVDCSNAIRISNVTGKKLILNVVNCTFDKWEGDNGGSKEYAGMIIFQDYTSTSAAATAENNLFGPDKVSVNIINCTHAGQKITWDNIADVCATNNDKQLFYVYGDKVGIIAYDEDRYPKFTVQ